MPFKDPKRQTWGFGRSFDQVEGPPLGQSTSRGCWTQVEFDRRYIKILRYFYMTYICAKNIISPHFEGPIRIICTFFKGKFIKPLCNPKISFGAFGTISSVGFPSPFGFFYPNFKRPIGILPCGIYPFESHLFNPSGILRLRNPIFAALAPFKKKGQGTFTFRV